jgi:hypothetical protein
MTCIERSSSGLRVCSLCSALRDLQLKSSEPQNSTFKGSGFLLGEVDSMRRDAGDV